MVSPRFVPALRTALWASAVAAGLRFMIDYDTTPGVTVEKNDGGIEAGRFNIVTSGHTLLYDAEGALRFSGGITPSRGHHGDNLGSDSVISFVNQRIAGSGETPVFGCPIKERAPWRR